MTLCLFICLPVSLSVCHNSEFYRNGYTFASRKQRRTIAQGLQFFYPKDMGKILIKDN